MEHAQFEFRSFLLQISKDLTEKEFEELKFVLKGYVTSAKCEKMTEAFHYFEELQKMLLLTPTRLEVLKKALNVVGRSDLVEKLQEKEQFSADLFSPQVTEGDNLKQTEYDAVCAGIEKAAGNLQPPSRSDLNNPNECSVPAMVQKATTVNSQERDHGNNEQTLLHAAAQSGNVDTLLEILALGFDIDSKNRDGLTPLMIVASDGRLNAFNLLLERGADPTLNDNEKWTVLHYAANGNNDKIIEKLLSRRLDIDSRSSDGSTPLMIAAFNGRLNAFNLLLEKGADPTLEDNNGGTLLHNAAEGNNDKIIEKLLSLNLNINSRNNNGQTALMLATYDGRAEAVKYLLGKGAR